MITHINKLFIVSFHISPSNVVLSGIMQVIDANPANAKALYRRGMAYMTLGDFEEARDDFETVNFLFSMFGFGCFTPISKLDFPY